MNQYAQPVIMSNNPDELFAMLVNESSKLDFLKNNLSSVFQKVGSFILDSSRELDTFRKLIKPYLEYFYPLEVLPDAECFINEVVEPTRREMEMTINKAVIIMQGDSEVNACVSRAIREALSIQPIVQNLIEMIEAIETYSWNAMLVSVKAGLEGQALAKISEQVSNLSCLANSTAEKCSGIIDSLNARYGEFDGICEEIDIINENYLTQMSVKSGMIFREMKNELENLSKSVNLILGCASEVEVAISNLMSRLQMEDLVRQDIEKVMCIVEEMNAYRDHNGFLTSMYQFDDPSKVDALLIALTAHKLREISDHTRPLVDGTSSCCEKMKEIINGFIGRFYGKQEAAEREYLEGTRFEEICSKLENMKDEFVGYIEKIISSKKNLYRISEDIVQTLGQFGPLFEEIGKISRRFEIINMMTKIELAKHSELQKSIGASLTGVSNLPAVMKKIVENALQRYHQVMSSIESALCEYRKNFAIEEETLNQCIDTMRKISVKMFESQKYYRDISEKVGSTSMSLMAFMEMSQAELASVREIVEIIDNVMFRMDEYEASCLEDIVHDDVLMSFVKSVKENTSTSSDTNHRAMLLCSLLDEMAQDSGGEKVVLF